MTTRPHLTILFHNEPGLPGLTSLWGFAALIRFKGRTPYDPDLVGAALSGRPVSVFPAEPWCESGVS